MAKFHLDELALVALQTYLAAAYSPYSLVHASCHQAGNVLLVPNFFFLFLPTDSTAWYLLRAEQIGMEKKIKEYLPKDLQLPSYFFIYFHTLSF